MIDDRPFLAVVCVCVLTIGAGGGDRRWVRRSAGVTAVDCWSNSVCHSPDGRKWRRTRHGVATIGDRLSLTSKQRAATSKPQHELFEWTHCCLASNVCVLTGVWVPLGDHVHTRRRESRGPARAVPVVWRVSVVRSTLGPCPCGAAAAASLLVVLLLASSPERGREGLQRSSSLRTCASTSQTRVCATRSVDLARRIEIQKHPTDELGSASQPAGQPARSNHNHLLKLARILLPLRVRRGGQLLGAQTTNPLQACKTKQASTHPVPLASTRRCIHASEYK